MKKIIILTLLSCWISSNLYSQNTLQNYINTAKLNSPLINNNKNDNQIIQLNVRQIKNLLYKPQIDFEANVLFAPIISHDNGNYKLELVSEGANNYTGYDLAYSDGGQYQSVVAIKQPLFTKSIYEAYSQQAKISTQLNNNNISLTQHELEKLVSHQYILCLKAKKHSEISNLLIKELGKQLQSVNKFVEAAILKQTDLMLMQIEIENDKLEYQNYISEYNKSILDLNLLCGITDTTIVQLEDQNFELKPDTVKISKYLTSFKLDSLRVIAEENVFNQKYKPQLSAYANAGMSSVYLPDYNRFGLSAGLNLSWNIFDGNQKKINHDKSLIKIQTISFNKKAFANKYELRKQKLLAQLKFLTNKINIIANQLVKYNDLIKVYSIELSKAQVSIIDYINLTRDVAKKEQELIDLQIEKQMLINYYNYWNY